MRPAPMMIGQEVSISMSTVKFHVASVMTTLAAHNRVELAMWAYQTGRLRESQR